MKKHYFLIIILTFFIANAQIVSTFAGSGVAGSTNGTGIVAQFNNPSSICGDASGNIYVADLAGNVIRKITSVGVVTTLAGSGIAGTSDGFGTAASFSSPTGVCADASGNIYVADRANNRIRKITPSGIVTTVAGSVSGFSDGIGTAAKFNSPFGVCIDASGNLYVADSSNNRVRKITSSGEVTTVAGSTAGYASGFGTAAQFYSPTGISVDASGNIYVVDNGNNAIRKINTSGYVSTIAGNGSGYVDGDGTVAKFNFPTGIAIDASSNLYITDNGNNKIRKITPIGVVSTLVGSTLGYLDGAGITAQFHSPNGVCITGLGNVYIADSGNNRIRKMTLCSNSNISVVNILPSTTAAVCSGQSVILTANTGANFLWNGGQNTSSTTVNPTQNTQYSVTINNSAGCTATASINVAVIPNASVTISGPNTLCNGQNVTLTASGVSSYSWNNGSITSSITVSPSTTTTYTVTGTDSCGFVSTSSRTVNIVNTSPTIEIQQPTCNNLTGNLLVTSPISNISSLPNSIPTDLYISEVTDQAIGSLTYIEIFNGTGNAVDLNNYKLKIYYNGNSAYSTDLQLVGLLSNNTVTVIAIGSATNQGGVIPNQVFVSAGGINTNDNIKLTTSSGVEIDSWGRTDGVDFTPSNLPGYVYRRLPTAPVPSLTWNPADWIAIDPEDYNDVGTYGPFLFYEYSLDNQPWQSSTQFNSLAPGVHTISVRETSFLGCNADTTTSSFTIDNPIPQVSITGNDSVCYGQNITLTASGGSSYLWSNGSYANTITVNPSVTTTYTVSATSPYGCSVIASKTITVNPLPNISIAPNTAITCLGQNITLTSSGGSSYLWNNGAVGSSLVVAPTTPTTYSVIGTDSNGCSATASKTVNIYPSLTTSISADGVVSTSTTITNGNAVQLQLNGSLNAQPNIQWTPASAISAATVANPLVYPTSTTTYTASFINSNGCPQTTSITVNVNPQPIIGNLSVSSPNATVGLFDTITVNVQLNNAADLYSLYMKLKGNAAVSQYLDYSGYTAGTLFGSNVISTPPTVTNGIPDFGITKVGAVPGYSGNGLFYTFTFVPKNISIPAGTTFCFYLDNVNAYNSLGIPCSLTNQGQTCFTFTNQVAVWPGDLNRSNTVSTADLLPIGYFYNSIGSVRPNATIQWTAQPATLWGYNHSTPNGDAYKVFADSNGDGVINNADQAAIGFNMNQVHSKINTSAVIIPPPHFTSEQLTTAVGTLTVTPNTSVINAATLPQTVIFTVNVNNIGGLSALYGISVNLGFDATVFDLSTATVDYTGSIFGNVGTDCLVMNYTSSNMVSVGLTRYANAAINGQGFLFKVTIQTKTTLPSLTETHVSAYADAANNQVGDTLAIQDAPTANLTIINNLGINGINQDEFVLYPNPASDKIYLVMNSTTLTTNSLKVKVYNTLGQRVVELPIHNATMEIATKNWGAEGVYFVQILNAQEQILYIKKIILQ